MTMHPASMALRGQCYCLTSGDNPRSLIARALTKAGGSLNPEPTLSTPLDKTFTKMSVRKRPPSRTRTSVEPDIAASSPAFPLITVACHAFNRSIYSRLRTALIETMETSTFHRLLAKAGSSYSNGIEDNRLPLCVCMYT